MGYLYYTLIGIGLYLISERLLDLLETSYGRRFKYRSLIFFAIITTLAMITVQMVALYDNP